MLSYSNVRVASGCSPLLRLGVLASAAGLLFTGCSTRPTAELVRQQPEKKVAEINVSPGSSTPPEFEVLAPIAGVLSSVRLEGVEYFAVLQKVTFTYTTAANGATTLALKTGSDIDALALGDAKDRVCTENGAALNDLTVDYHHAAVLARGLELASVRVPRANAPLVMLAMSQGEVATWAQYTGPGKHDHEFAYETCIGPHRADGFGHRLLTYLPSDATLSFHSLKTKQITDIKLDPRFTPYVLMRFADGAMTAAPSRIVLVTVDGERRRVNVHYRTLFRANNAIRKAELRAVLPPEFGGTPEPGENATQFRDRSERRLVQLANCALPTKFGEPCAELSNALPR
jgi:hypothetical protein